MSRTSRSPEQLAHGWHAALVERDAGAFAALFAPDGVMLDVEHRTADLSRARPIRGRAAIAELAVGWLRDTPELRFEITGVLADDPRPPTVDVLRGVRVQRMQSPWRASRRACLADGMITEALVSLWTGYALMQGLGTTPPG